MGNIKIGNTNINPTEVKFKKDGITKDVDVVQFINKNNSGEYLYSKNEVNLYTTSVPYPYQRLKFSDLNWFSDKALIGKNTVYGKNPTPTKYLIPNYNGSFADYFINQGYSILPENQTLYNYIELENSSGAIKNILKQSLQDEISYKFTSDDTSTSLIPTNKKQTFTLHKRLKPLHLTKANFYIYVGQYGTGYQSYPMLKEEYFPAFMTDNTRYTTVPKYAIGKPPSNYPDKYPYVEYSFEAAGKVTSFLFEMYNANEGNQTNTVPLNIQAVIEFYNGSPETLNYSNIIDGRVHYTSVRQGKTLLQKWIKNIKIYFNNQNAFQYVHILPLVFGTEFSYGEIII